MRFVATLAALSCLALTLPAQATPGDAVADHVLGQLNFANSAPGLVDSRGLHDPSSIAIDRASIPNRLYVADYDNHRVLGWRNARNFKKGTPADLVIGQVDFNSAACNRGGAASNKTLCLPTGLSVDGAGDLYVADGGNNRVLRFASPFTSGLDADQPAAAVFGQADFSANLCNRSVSFGPASADTLCGPAGTAVDASGNLYVADGAPPTTISANNSRVLEYDDPKAGGGGTPGVSGAAGDKTADRVFGQASFTAVLCNRSAASTSPAADTLCAPTDVSIDAAGDLLIADKSNNRVLVFVDPLANRVADQVFGQADFVHKDLGSGPNDLREPTGVVVAAAGNLWIADFNSRLLQFNAPLLGSNGRSASRTFGTTSAFPSAKDIGFASDVDHDAFGNLYVADGAPPPSSLEGGGYSRVVRLEDPLGTDAIPDGGVGQKGYMTSLPNRIDVRSLAVPRGIAFDRSVNPPHVYVVDSTASRVLGWANASTFVDGAPADLVIGQPSFKVHYCNRGVGTPATASTLCYPTDVAVDASGNVWVADTDNHRVLGYAPPFGSGLVADQPASRVLGQADFSGNLANRTGQFNAPAGANTLKSPRGIATDSDNNLWVADASNFRVLMFKKPFAQDGNADAVLGQANLTSATVPASASPDTMLSPVGVFVDGPGNVYVSDGGYNRVVLYIKPLASGGGTPGTPGSKGDRTGDRVFGQSLLTSPGGCNSGGRTAQSLCGPAGVALDSTGSLWVVDGSNNRLLRYDSPLTGDATADAVIGAGDFTSNGTQCGNALRSAAGFCFPYGIEFDPGDNLWVSETGSNRVLIFDAN